jgi:hypothetical protein
MMLEASRDGFAFLQMMLTSISNELLLHGRGENFFDPKMPLIDGSPAHGFSSNRLLACMLKDGEFSLSRAQDV